MKRSMRQVHRAGERLFVDFAGPTLSLTDGTRANICVAALGASHYTFVLATPAQKSADWIAGMSGALTSWAARFKMWALQDVGVPYLCHISDISTLYCSE